MASQITSLKVAINALKQHQEKLKSQLGKSNLERLIFNLEEINLDIEKFANELIDGATKEAALEQLTKTLDSFQYGSIPHILGHLETIEELLENNCYTFPIRATDATISIS
ncbi:MAG TPA: hypothetical protein VK211_27470 [Kamptonema sp.]|nr:hypothetical protein [Kamptonema sp.]